MRSSVLDSSGGLARGNERRHQAEGGLRAERIDYRELAPPVGRSMVVAARGGFLRQCRERVAELLRKLCALGIHPALELRRPSDEEPVEERTRVSPDRGFGVAALQRVL